MGNRTIRLPTRQAIDRATAELEKAKRVLHVCVCALRDEANASTFLEEITETLDLEVGDGLLDALTALKEAGGEIAEQASP